MDPPSLIHGHSPNARSPAASGPSFGLADIWPLDSAIVRGIQSRRGRFGQDLGFSESVRDGSAPEESTVTEQSGRLGGGGGGRKRREVAAVAASEDEALKPASTSSGNDVVGKVDRCSLLVDNSILVLVLVQWHCCNFVGFLRLMRSGNRSV